MMSDQGYSQAIIGRSDLAQVLRGGERRGPAQLGMMEKNLPLASKETLVVWLSWTNRPCAIVVNDGDYDDLLAWLSAYHADLLPLTSWCHLFAWSEWMAMESKHAIVPEFSGLEAAWSGAIISEAADKTKRDYSQLSLTSCCATRSFAVARAYALHGPELATALCLSPPQSSLRPYSDALEISGTYYRVFQTLLALRGSSDFSDKGSNNVLSICRHLSMHGGYVEESRRFVDKNLSSLFSIIPGLPEVPAFSRISAEDSVRLLRAIRSAVSDVPVESVSTLLFLSGFIIAQIGGAERDLKLSQQFSEFGHDVALWATVIGGLGSENHWGDAFLGLGRLVARELTRPFRLSDAPECDISYGELLFLERKSPRASSGVRTANRNVLSVSLKAGVLLSFYPPDTRASQNENAAQNTTSTHKSRQEDDPWRDVDLQLLAKRLMPHLLQMIQNDFFTTPMRKNKRTQAELKLKD